ncbi:T7SS effector LXG polymorphic toxin [Salipaludibacillus sp. HK11]|uniref:T7SS effector LXG polymorphic toxin n=1 Tax=Salipaludibacillus sp. HK11 TaxID=3394320 RepID=UPI0039FDB963
MGHKVDLSEVIDFSDEFKSTSEDITVSLLKVAQNIEDICNMSSFSGKTADQAKLYFSDFHLTMLTTFNGLLNDLYQNLNQHIEDFQSKVDESSKTIINSDYVRDTMEDLHEQNEALEVLHNEVSNIIRSVSDISSVTTPSFRFVKDDHDTAINVAENVLEDVQSFRSVGRRSSAEIESLLQEIKTTLNHADAVSGSARFTDYKGGTVSAGLATLREYNKTLVTSVEVNQDSIKYMSLLQIKQLNDAAVKGMDETTQKILNRAFTDLISGKITRATYYDIFTTMKKSTKDLSEGELNEEVPETVMEYIFNNKGKIGIDLAVNTTVGAVKFIGNTTREIGSAVGGIGTSIKSIGDLFSRISSNAANAVTGVGDFATKTSNVITKTGQFVQGAGRSLGGVFIVASAGVGFYEDLNEKGKTVGEAIAHNGASVVAGLAGGAAGTGLVTGLATVFAVSNPVGWAIVGGVAVGSVAAWGFNYMYDNNVAGIQNGLDAVGRKLDDVGESIGALTKDAGEAVSNGLNAINPMNWGW